MKAPIKGCHALFQIEFIVYSFSGLLNLSLSVLGVFLESFRVLQSCSESRVSESLRVFESLPVYMERASLSRFQATALFLWLLHWLRLP